MARRIIGWPADFFKVAPGPILAPRGGQNRIPREKLCRFHLFSQFFDRFFENHDFRKIDFSKKMVIFYLLIGILKPGSIKIERGMKKYFWGLILRFFGLMGSSLVPGEGPS